MYHATDAIWIKIICKEVLSLFTAIYRIKLNNLNIKMAVAMKHK